jgi:hypothetical protein
MKVSPDGTLFKQMEKMAKVSVKRNLELVKELQEANDKLKIAEIRLKKADEIIAKFMVEKPKKSKKILTTDTDKMFYQSVNLHA